MALSQRLERLFTTVEQERASDLHLATNQLPVLRVSRELVPISSEPPITAEEMDQLLAEMIGEEKVRHVHLGIEQDFSFQFHNELRLRGNAYRQADGLGAALRVIQSIRTLDRTETAAANWAQFTRMKQGFFLIVGPPGMESRPPCRRSLILSMPNAASIS